MSPPAERHNFISAFCWGPHEIGKRIRPGNAGLLSMKDLLLHRAQQGCHVKQTALMRFRQ